MSRPVAGRPSFRRELPLDVMGCPFVLEGGVSISSVPLHLPLHAHAGYELHYLESGTMRLLLPEGAVLAAQGGDLILTQPGVWHQGEHQIAPASRHLWMVVDPLAPDVDGNIGLRATEGAALSLDLRRAGNRVLPASELRQSYRHLVRLLKEHEAGRAYAAERLRHACASFLLGAAALLRSGNSEVTRHLSQACMQAIALIRDHLRRPLTVDRIADEVGLSVSRFHELFLAETGETPAAYCLRLRCSRGAEYLREQPQRPIGAIARSLGFADQRYFATCFKRVFGVSPSGFRAMTLWAAG